ncbi:bystin-like [Uloborus diversus]|uniref:bystin-like n=1 Tax=Uloborus diversus TaxID=327109 RepID=UPI0024096BA3|nr:bystin-like [Uloborus diversus]
MGKVKKNKSKNSNRHDPLDQQIIENNFAKSSFRNKVRNRQDEDEEFVDDKLTKKILKQARKQQEDLEEEVGISIKERKACPSISLNLSPQVADSDDDDDDASITKGELLEDLKINEEDEKAFQSFMCKDPVQRATLADYIKEKLTEKQTEIQTIFSDAGSLRAEDLEKIAPLYKGVAQVLSRYRSGKLPKAFKVVPKFTNWEQILQLTEPEKWTSAAVYQATRIFSSNLKEKMAQRFYNLVLLPRLRDDIAEAKTLNFHLYEALKKALFKPAAFFKGIILPLCESGTCTLREATIFGSVLAKCSIPILHSSAALLRIADMDYNGANSIFMRILLEKKYALPFRVVDAVVAHFLRFKNDDRQLPLLWHQCLLTFAQLYKNDISQEQQLELLELLTIHPHTHVTPEIRRELQSSTYRNSQKTVNMDLN